MDSEGVLSEILFSTFEKAIGGHFEEVLKKNEHSHEVCIFFFQLGALIFIFYTKKRMVNMVSELRESAKNVKLEDLVYYKKLGSGMFGSVFLVKEKEGNDRFYALKCVSKQQVIEQHLERHLQVEHSS